MKQDARSGRRVDGGDTDRAPSIDPRRRLRLVRKPDATEGEMRLYLCDSVKARLRELDGAR